MRNAAKILLAVALAATLQWARTPVFATPRARSGHMIRRRVGDELSSVFYGVQNPNFQAAVASAWAFVQATLTPAANLAKSLQQVREFASNWRKQKPFEGQDADTHVKELTGRIEEAIAAGKNVLIPTAQEADLPLEPIRGAPFEKLMVAAPQNISMVGVYALHAEPGAGKSTAATLAALELKGRQPKDVIVVLQNDFERQVESFRLRVLARAANANLHQIIVIGQSEAAAKDIGDLNGDTTQKGEQMPAVWYRWSREETLELLNRTSGIQELLEQQLGKDREQRAEERNVLLTEALELALERSQIPDKYGCWRPRSTTRYIMTGNRPTAPTAPLPIPGEATGSFSYISFSMSSKKVFDELLDQSSKCRPTHSF